MARQKELWVMTYKHANVAYYSEKQLALMFRWSGLRWLRRFPSLACSQVPKASLNQETYFFLNFPLLR